MCGADEGRSSTRARSDLVLEFVVVSVCVCVCSLRAVIYEAKYRAKKYKLPTSL